MNKKCNIIFNIGGESITVASGIDSSLIPSQIDLDFLNILKQSGQFENAVDILQKFLQEGNLKKLQDNNYDQVVANTNAKFLSQLYPTIEFPDIELENVKILFINKFENYTNTVIKYSVSGERIYVVDNNYDNIRKLARHLKVLNSIENDVLEKFDENSPEIKTLNTILLKAQNKFKKANLLDIKSMLVHFIFNKSKYNNIKIGDKTVQFLLNDIIPTIEGVYHKRKNDFKNDLVSQLYLDFKFNNKQILIKKSNVYNSLELKGYKLDYFKNKSDFYEKMSSVEKPKEVIEFINNEFGINVTDVEGSGFNILLNLIFEQERGFPYRYENIIGDNIILDSTYYKINETYGITYDQILLMEQDDYRGWKIYKNGDDSYFISEFELGENSYGKEYTTKREAKLAIDQKIDSKTFRSSFRLPIFQKLNDLNISMQIQIDDSQESFKKGTIIKVPNILLAKEDINKIKSPKEAIILGDYNLNDFIEFIKNNYSAEVQNILIKDGKLIKRLDNINNSALFIYLLNIQYGDQTRTPEMVNNVLDYMKNRGYIYFYVDSIDYRKNYKVINLAKIDKSYLTKEDFKKHYKEQYPIVAFWNNISEVLKKTFGVTVNVLTQSEIAEKFDVYHSNQKAFIIGDQIYINTTLGTTSDLFHEYIHIIMAYMKNNEELLPKYEQLLQEVWENTPPKERNNINKLYKNYSYIDKLEENFVTQYGKYIANHSGNNINELLKNSKSINQASETIFDKAELDLKELGRYPLSTIFGRFSSEISLALQNNSKMFQEFMNLRKDEFRLSSKKTNLLKKWIETGKLKETNCK